LQDLRNDIISHFFQSLTLRSENIISVARRSLEQDYCEKLPKDLLKLSLRPILLNVNDYRRLSVPLLEGLSRLLELLKGSFNSALGMRCSSAVSFLRLSCHPVLTVRREAAGAPRQVGRRP
jgi:transformation/transcription domain-associated protein